MLECADGAREYLLYRCRQCVALCPSNLYLGKLAELNDGLGEIQDVVAALKEAIQAHKESVVLGAKDERTAEDNIKRISV